jgi:arginyl-tRNA--protein-N-Asp/Glu arginylyltransferase
MIPNLLKEIKTCEDFELYKKYKIQVNSDGTVYDTKSKKLYNNLIEWINGKLDFFGRTDTLSK